MIYLLFIATQLFSGVFGGVGPIIEECDDCCVPDIDKYSDCFKDCMTPCLSPPIVNFEMGTYSTPESNDVEICVIRSGSTDGTSSVTLMLQDGTALAGLDFIASADVLTFLPGSARKCVTVTIVDDGTFEGNETFSVTLTSPSNATVGSVYHSDVTIVDNDK